MIRNDVPMTTTPTTTSSHDGYVHLPHDTDVHLSVCSSIGAFILSPNDDVHQSVRSSISWWRRSSHWTSFRYTMFAFPSGIVVLNALFPSTATFERKLWTEAHSFVCCCRCCGLLLASLCLRRFCFLLGPGALLLLLMFFEPGFQEDSLRKHKN